jgi:glucose uptake protein
MGLILSAGAAISWGTFFVPVRKVNIVNVWHIQGFTGIGVLLFALPIGVFSGLDILPSGVLSGVIWTSGNMLALYSVRLIGLARTSPFLAGFNILASFTWGIFFFDEKFNFMILAICAIGFLLGGLPLISSATKSSTVQREGYFIAVTAGLLVGSYDIPMQATHSLQTGFFSSSLSIFVIGLPLLFLTKRWVKKEMLAGIISGSLFNVGSLSVLMAIASIGITVAYPISQTATLFAVSWGILYFKEIVHRGSIIRVISGSIMVLVGAVLLSFA